MSHWSKDVIVDRVESELAEMETLEVFSYIIKNKLGISLIFKYIFRLVDMDELKDEYIVDHLFETTMNEGPY